MKKTLSIVLLVLLVFLAVACSPEHKHDYKLVPEKTIAATCTSNGYNYMECSCGAIQSIPTAALGHDYVEKKDEYKAPTCAEEGKRVTVCSRCGDRKETVLLKDANNHPFFGTKGGLYNNVGTATFSKWPTCEEDGEATFTYCSECSKAIEYTTVVPKECFSKNSDGTAKANTVHVKLTNNASSFTKGIDMNKAVANITSGDVENHITVSEATAFVTGTEASVCPTCGETVAAATLAYETIPVDTSLAIADWTFSELDSDEKGTWSKLWIDITRTNGFYSASAYSLESVEGTVAPASSLLADNGAVAFLDLSETDVADVTLEAEKKIGDYLSLTNACVLAAETEKSFYILTQAVADWDGGGDLAFETGDYIAIYLTNAYDVDIEDYETHSDWSNVALGEVLGEDVVVVDKNEHSHNLELMHDRRSINSSEHYAACACGLEYVSVSHADGCECGYSSTKGFTVSLTLDSVTDTYWLPSGSAVTVPAGSASGTTYSNFFGTSEQYTGKPVVSGQSSESTASTFYCTDGGTLEITLAKKQ